MPIIPANSTNFGHFGVDSSSRFLQEHGHTGTHELTDATVSRTLATAIATGNAWEMKSNGCNAYIYMYIVNVLDGGRCYSLFTHSSLASLTS